MANDQPESGQPQIKELTGKIGKYEIEKPLGKGAMGMVYLAHDTVLDRDVALKVMVASIADDPELKARFEREAKAVAKMSHPNVVNVFDLGNHTDGSPFIAMELLKGMDLQKAMRTPPPLTLERKLNVIVQTLVGLAHAHQAGIVHRDIKPANIFLNHDGTVKIMDFGVARLTTASMTGTGNIVGTADYMSPEQVKGARVDGRSDLFSVGCMLYELMAGRRPFHSDNLMAIFYKITHEEPNFSLIPGDEEHQGLMPVLQKALAKNLEDRYQTAYEFANDLREYLKTLAAAGGAESALEGLLDMEPPPGTLPPPIHDDGDEGPAGATMALGATAVGPQGTGSGTLKGAATVVQGTRSGAGPTVAQRPPTKAGPRSLPPTQLRTPVQRPQQAPAPPPAPASGTPVLYVVLGVLGALVVVFGGFAYYKSQQAPEKQIVVITQPTTTTLAPPPTTAPPTLAPQPTFAEAVGKGAVAIKAAQAALRDGNYDRAMAKAQEALVEDPGNSVAKDVMDRALKGQSAANSFRAAEAALAQNDFARALAEAEKGREAAPWDRRAVDLIAQINEKQRAAQQAAEAAKAGQVAAQVGKLLSEADSALAAKNYDGAIGLYDKALELDPTNSRALNGKSATVQARALSQAASTQATQPAGRKFVSGRTTATAADAGGSAPPGFEETAGVNVKKGTSAADLPGKVVFETNPESPRAGEKYTVSIYLVNEGQAPIQLRELFISTRKNGRNVGGPVPLQTKEVAPAQRGLLISSNEVWSEDTTAWAMEARITTTRGDKYSNTLTWK